MKNLLNIFIIVSIYFILYACSNSSSTSNEKKEKLGRSFIIYKGDTSNIMDEKGLKQGKWYIFKLASNGVPMNNTPLDTLFYKNDTIIEK